MFLACMLCGAGVDSCDCKPKVLALPIAEESLRVFSAVDRLNSWVRSESYKHGSSFPTVHHVIYWLKNEAIKWAVSRGIASHRRVAMDLQCRDCRGTKRYTDWNGYTWPHCRACSSTGTVHLTFIETTIGEIRWHTPFLKADFVKGATEWPEHPCFDWSPNRPGKDLEPHEAAALLNLIEAEVPHGNYPARYVRCDRDDWDGYNVNDWEKYSLFLGRTDAGQCDICGATEAVIGHGFGLRQDRLEWTGHACERCNTSTTAIFERLKERGPAQLIEHPDIQKWIERHPVKPGTEKRPAW